MDFVHKKIIDDLVRKHGVNRRVIETICRTPFTFAAKTIRDDDDERPIMIYKFGKFKIKKSLVGKKREMADKAYDRLEKRKEYYRKRYENSLINDNTKRSDV